MEIKKCNCGKASMTYEGIGEDSWSGEPVNTIFNSSGGGIACTCKDCKQVYDSFDPFMVKLPMKLVQIIKCKCGSTFAGGVLPESMLDDNWNDELKYYLKKGCTVDIVYASGFKFEKCKCTTEESNPTSTPDNQLALDLRDTGIQKAEEHANNVNLNWSEKTFKLFEEFIKLQQNPFLTEDFRSFAKKCGLEDPPSNRAFGGIILKAKKANLIKHRGYASVKNPKAHLTPASLWSKA